MKTLILSALIVMTLNAKDHNWQTGTVIDSYVNSNYVGQTGGPSEGCPSCASLPINVTIQTIVIAADDYTYTANQLLRWKWTKAAAVVVNTPVKFAVEIGKQKNTALGGKLFLIDGEGKQYELNITKQIHN